MTRNVLNRKLLLSVWVLFLSFVALQMAFAISNTLLNIEILPTSNKFNKYLNTSDGKANATNDVTNMNITNWTIYKAKVIDDITIDNITNRTIYYVHTGKTGGTTLGFVLRAICDWYRLRRPKEECFKKFHQFNESRLSMITKTHHHTSMTKTNHEWLPKSTSFLFSLRNPIDRAVSAFDMEHPMNTNITDKAIQLRTAVFYDECFPDAEVLAMILANKNHTVFNSWNKDCYAVGYNTLIGKGHMLHASHLNNNYGSYVSKTSGKYPKREVFVARTEYLWEDLGALNLALGGNSDFTEHMGVKNTHGSEVYKVKSKLSALGRVTFCCYLHQENKFYEELLQSAVNLSTREKTKTLRVLYKDCGIPFNQYQNTSFSWKKWAQSTCDI